MKKQVYFTFANTANTDKASDVYRLFEKQIEGWIASGAVTLREYHANSKNTIILRFVESFTTSEQNKVIQQLKDVKMPTSRIVSFYENINHVTGSEVDYTKKVETEVDKQIKTGFQGVADWASIWNPLMQQTPSSGYALSGQIPMPSPPKFSSPYKTKSHQITQQELQEAIDEYLQKQRITQP